jgi:hypothetical protein
MQRRKRELAILYAAAERVKLESARPPTGGFMRRTTFALTALLAALALPASRARAQDSTAVPPEKPTADYITREQLTEQKFSTLYDLIESMHNNWLRERIPSPGDRAVSGNRADTTGKAQYTNDYNAAGKSFPGQNGGIQVYVDGTRAGSLDQLKTIRPAELWSVRRINGIDAQGRFGIGHGAGVIYVVTVGGKDRAP